MFKTLKNAIKTPEIRKRLLYTLLLIVIFRLVCYISVPGIDTLALEKLTTGFQNSITGLIDIISGLNFTNSHFFAVFKAFGVNLACFIL